MNIPRSSPLEGEHTPTIIQLIRSTDLAVIQFKDSHIYSSYSNSSELEVKFGITLTFECARRTTSFCFCYDLLRYLEKTLLNDVLISSLHMEGHGLAPTREGSGDVLSCCGPSIIVNGQQRKRVL